MAPGDKLKDGDQTVIANLNGVEAVETVHDLNESSYPEIPEFSTERDALRITVNAESITEARNLAHDPITSGCRTVEDFVRQLGKIARSLSNAKLAPKKAEHLTNEHLFHSGPPVGISSKPDNYDHVMDSFRYAKEGHLSDPIELETEIDATWDEGKEQFRIPEQFEIMGRTYTVSLDPKVMNDSQWGEISFRDAAIRIYPAGCEIDIKPEVVEISFCHELIHLILDDAGQTELSKDETAVELMGKILHQFFVTKRGSLGTSLPKPLPCNEKL